MIGFNMLEGFRKTAWKAAALPLSYTRIAGKTPDFALIISNLAFGDVRDRRVSTPQFRINPDQSGKIAGESPNKIPTGVPPLFPSMYGRA